MGATMLLPSILLVGCGRGGATTSTRARDTGVEVPAATRDGGAQAPSESAPVQSEIEGREHVAGGRLLPPSALACSRDHLTSYSGRPLAYERTPDRIVLRIRTDEETTESVTLSVERGEDPLRWLLIEGEPFQSGDWARVETALGRLREGVRVIAWVCDDGSKPVLDWRPSEGAVESAPASEIPR